MFNFEKSKWIWIVDNETINNYVQFKRIISLNESDLQGDCNIFLTVDSDYALYVNGVFVNCGQYQFGKNRFSYDTLNLNDYLKLGVNRICFLVHYQGVSSSQYVKNFPGLIYRIKCGDRIFYSNENTFARHDKCYLSGEYFKISNQLGFNFLYDAKYEDDWLKTYDIDSSWQKSKCRNVKDEVFLKRPIMKCELLLKRSASLINHGYFRRGDLQCNDIAKLMQTDYLKYAKKLDLVDLEGYLKKESESDGIYLIYDLGVEIVGHFYIVIETVLGAVVDFSYGEHLKDLRVRAKIGNRNFANRYICRAGKQIFSHHFTRIAGRFIEIHIMGFGEKTKIYDVGIIPMEYVIKTRSNIVFNDFLYAKIYDVSLNTLKICMHEHYEDTPWREQALYAMDSRNQALFGYYCFSEYKFARESINLLGLSIRDDGYLGITAPCDNELTIPYFSMMWIVEIDEYMMFSGDVDFANSYIKQTERMIETYLKNSENNICIPPYGEKYWNFYDWSEGLSGEKKTYSKCKSDILYQLFLILAMQAHDNMAKYCTAAENSFEDEIFKLKAKVNEVFYNTEMDMYATYICDDEKYHYCELAQALAIITKTCSEKRSRRLRETMANENNLVKTSISHSIFKIEAFVDERKSYQKYILNYLENVFGNMIFSNATSFWETENGEADFNGAGSLSHGWSAVPVYIFYRYLLGVYPTKPGFVDYICDPIGNKISKVNVQTPSGDININDI